MIGKHHVNIETSGLKYSFDIRRNITIIQGDSATGKTTLIELLADYKRLGPGQESMFLLMCRCMCIPVTAKTGNMIWMV